MQSPPRHKHKLNPELQQDIKNSPHSPKGYTFQPNLSLSPTNSHLSQPL